jgi:hypothetical protein
MGKINTMSELIRYIHDIVLIMDDLKNLKPWQLLKKYKTKKKFKEICSHIDEISVFELSNDIYTVFTSNIALPMHKNITLGTGHIKFNIDDCMVTYIARTNRFIVNSNDYIYEVYSVNNHYSGNYNRWIETSNGLRKMIYSNIKEIINYISYGGIIEYGAEGEYICRANNKQEKEVRLEEFIVKA